MRIGKSTVYKCTHIRNISAELGQKGTHQLRRGQEFYAFKFYAPERKIGVMNRMRFPMIPNPWKYIEICRIYNQFSTYARSRSKSPKPAQNWCIRIFYNIIRVAVKQLDTQLAQNNWTKSVDGDFIVCLFVVEYTKGKMIKLNGVNPYEEDILLHYMQLTEVDCFLSCP